MRSLRRFFLHWQNWLGLLLVVLFVFVAVAAPLLSPQDPKKPGPVMFVGRTSDTLPKPPNQDAPLGTLPGQISVYHSLIWGTRTALLFGLAVAAFTALVGVLIGTISAYFGGFLNNILMRITDAFLAFPVIAGVVLISTIAFHRPGQCRCLPFLGRHSDRPHDVCPDSGGTAILVGYTE